jgi:hypothetical protein
MSYPNPKFKAGWVVHKVNPRERLHTPCTTDYQLKDEQADDVYQEEELPTTFTIDEGVALNSLVGDRNDVVGVWDSTAHPGLPLEVLLGRTVLPTVARWFVLGA